MAKKKASPAQRAWRKKFAAMYAKNPKGKKRRNPKVKYSVAKKPPRVTGTLKWPSKKKLTKLEAEAAARMAASGTDEQEYNKLASSAYARRFLLADVDKKAAKDLKAYRAVKKQLDKTKAQRDAAKAKLAELKGQADFVIEDWDKESENPMKKRKKRRSRRNPKSADYGMVTAGNPGKKKPKKKKAKAKKKKTAKKKGKSRKKATRRKRAAFPIVINGSAALTAKRRKAFSSKRRKRIKTKLTLRNPSIDMNSVKPLLYAAGGYVLALGLYKAADHYSKGQVSAQVGKVVPAQLQPFLLPAIGIGIGYALDRFSDKLPAGQREASELGKGAMLAGGVLAALAAVNVGVTMLKQNVPQLANIPVIGPMLSGVMFFPTTMGAADFGQIGDGYQQQPGDFGNVRYFPAGMQGVEFFPPGSRGDEMYVPSEANQLREAQGLGVYPEGMGSDGVDGIPEGMGEDPGQMG